MSYSNPETIRPYAAIAQSAYDRLKELHDIFLSETQADRLMIEQHKALTFDKRREEEEDRARTADERVKSAYEKFRSETQNENEIWEAWKPLREAGNALIKSRGLRYADATLDNYVGKLPEQTKIVQQLRDYAENSNELIPQGKNVILLGPKGTGKDHLLMALAKEVLRCSGFTTKWENGCDMHQRFRESAISNRPTVYRITSFFSIARHPLD